MKRIHVILALLAPLITLLCACDNDSVIGASISQDRIGITIDSTFTVSGHSQRIDSVQSRTISQLIGRIDAKGFGRLSSDVVTQFMAASKLDTANITVEGIDSLVLSMYVTKGEFVGDSVAPMGIDVYKLNRSLPSPIYSNFNPEDYYSPSDLLGSTIYNLSNNTNGSNSDGSTRIDVKLPLSLAQYLYSSYLKNPESFNTPTSFASVFPGVYIKNSYGSGRFSRVTTTLMTLHYHYKIKSESTGNDSTIYRTGNYFAVTPEIITNNNISLTISDNILQMVNSGDNIVLAPAGLEVRLRFPAREVIAAFNTTHTPVKVLNSLTFEVPGEAISNDYNLAPPTYLLMVLTKNKKEFFAKNTLPDNKTSFYATYNSTTGKYNFGEMRQYILDLISKGEITDDDIDFTITPVSAVFETSNQASSSYYYYYYGGSSTTTTLSMLTPYVASPVMARLRLDNAKIKLTYSSQTVQ